MKYSYDETCLIFNIIFGIYVDGENELKENEIEHAFILKEFREFKYSKEYKKAIYKNAIDDTITTYWYSNKSEDENLELNYTEECENFSIGGYFFHDMNYSEKIIISPKKNPKELDKFNFKNSKYYPKEFKKMDENFMISSNKKIKKMWWDAYWKWVMDDKENDINFEDYYEKEFIKEYNKRIYVISENLSEQDLINIPDQKEVREMLNIWKEQKRNNMIDKLNEK